MADQGVVRDLNQHAVLLVLRQHGPSSRAQLARTLGLTKATVSSIVAGLMDRDLVIEQGMTVVSDRGGRPGAIVTLNPRGATFLGAEFSESHITITALRLDGSEISRSTTELRRRLRLETILDRLCVLIKEMVDAAPADYPNVTALGVAVPGIPQADGTVSWISGLNWPRLDIGAWIEQRLDVVTVVENDANAAALAELLLAGDEVADDFVYLVLDTGVGSAIVADGRIYRGADGRSGEVGHMRLDVAGPPCAHCGGNGCFEGTVNVDSLTRYDLEAGGAGRTWEAVFAATDPSATQAVERWCWWLARGLTNLIYVLDPRQIVLGGVMAPAAEALVPDVQEATRGKDFDADTVVRIRVSSFGLAQGAVGAAALVYQSTFAPPSTADTGRTAYERGRL